MADCHIGAWRDPKLAELPLEAFRQAIRISIAERVDFILISGDLFNTSIPGIDKIKSTTQILKNLKDKNIPVYIIPGSHDFSPSGKTMLDVLEEAGLCINVVKGEVINNKLKLNFTVDKTGAKITGMLGLRNMLEKNHYDKLVRENLESEPGFKIFMFHSALTELKPKNLEKIESSPISLLPKNFDYYAGGHVHIVENKTLPGYKNVIYPGPLFPNSFSELQDLKYGGFYIYDDGKITRINIELHQVIEINVNCHNQNPEQVKKEITNQIKRNEKNFKNTLVLIHLHGTLSSGKMYDLNLNNIIDSIINKYDAYYVMKNTAALKTKEFEHIKIDPNSVDDIEKKIIQESVGKSSLDPKTEVELTNGMMRILQREKDQGERVSDYDDRIRDEVKQILNLK